MQEQQNLGLNVIHRSINRMSFSVSIFDFVDLKNVFRILKFFEVIRFIQSFEQIIFAFVLVFNFAFNLKFEISLSILNAIDVYCQSEFDIVHIRLGDFWIKTRLMRLNKREF